MQLSFFLAIVPLIVLGLKYDLQNVKLLKQIHGGPESSFSSFYECTCSGGIKEELAVRERIELDQCKEVVCAHRSMTYGGSKVQGLKCKSDTCITGLVSAMG